MQEGQKRDTNVTFTNQFFILKQATVVLNLRGFQLGVDEVETFFLHEKQNVLHETVSVA